MHPRTRRRLRLILVYVVLSTVAFINVFPILWTFLNSIKPPMLTFAYPPVFVFTPSIDSYGMLFFPTAYPNVSRSIVTVDLPRMFANSMIVAVTTCAITMVVACLGAYSLSRFRFAGRRSIGFFIISTRMLPPIATAIPLFLLMNNLGLVDSRLALIASYTAINIPFAIWMVRGFMDEIPRELEDAAMIDGCSRLQAMVRVVLPLIRPGLAASAVFAFLLAWNDFAIALILTAKDAKTLPLMVVSFITEEGVLWGPMSAAATLALLPPVIFVLLTHHHLARGLTMGGVKG
jgi:multiple sugar transport system permease protein